MSKTRVIFNQVGLFVGGCPASGFSYLSPDGVPINNSNLTGSTNLIFPLNRIISTNYSFAQQRTEIRQLSKASNLIRPIILAPDINIDFDYYQMGLINEARMGFYVNHNSGDPINGSLLYSNNACSISGFLDRSYQKSNDTPQGWPLTCRDSRNIFVAIKNGSDDLKNADLNHNTLNSQINVLAFGNCFLNSYKTSASVTTLPKCSVQYVADNVEYYMSGSGINIPAINPSTEKIYSGIICSIPNTYDLISNPTVVIPSDIKLSIASSGNNPGFSNNLSIDINDVKIQGYEISMNLNREPLYDLGYKRPLDRRVNLPVLVDLSFNMIVGDTKSGSFTNLLSNDDNYNISIKLPYQAKNQSLSGIAIQYDFIAAKFKDISFQQSIGPSKTATLNFTTEIDPDNPNNGFFMSGQLGVQVTQQTGLILLDINGSGLGLDMNNGTYLAIYNNTLTNQIFY